jgi:protein-S-isoprenylcysteine O-methyltransferase Ste14
MTNVTNFWVRWRVRVGYPVAIAFLLLVRPSPRYLAIGASVSAFGLLIRAWAAGYLRKHESLATEGPYAFTRNPLYFGSAVLAAGFVIAGRSIWAGALIVIYLLLFYPAVMRREQEELREKYGAEFDDYSKRAPIFWPRPSVPRKEHPPTTSFSYDVYLRNREYQALAGFIAGVALLWVKMHWFS